MPKDSSSSLPYGIRWIEIENFRRISHLRLEFLSADDSASEIAVLAGPNGCGKTSVLEACLIALGFAGELQGSKETEAITFGQQIGTIKAEIVTPNGLYNSLSYNHGPSHFHKISSDTNPPNSSSTSIPCEYYSSWRIPRLVGSLPITAGKRGKRPPDTEENRIWRTKQFLIDSKAHELMSGLKSVTETSVYHESLDVLNRVWALFYPGNQEHFEVEPVGGDPSDGFDVFLISPSTGRVPLDALSSGQLELFALFGSMMIGKFQSGILVIDEPELHLDPQWHALMLRAIRQFLPKVQLIVATHSPRVYDSVLSFQRHFLIPETDPRAKAWNLQSEGVA